jgi:hypothetical protein
MVEPRIVPDNGKEQLESTFTLYIYLLDLERIVKEKKEKFVICQPNGLACS